MTQSQVTWKKKASLPLSLPMTIEKILESEVDLLGIPKRSFFQILAEYSSDKMEKDRLLEFCSGRGVNLKREQD
jgi:sulfite reductase alpha subunit-like flavoprotein